MSNVKPKRFYKYRHCGAQALDLLVVDRIYFANPASFNDPLASKPVLKLDVNNGYLEQILIRLYHQRVRDKLTAAASATGYPARIDGARISQLIMKGTEALLADIRYNASDPAYENEAEATRMLLGASVQDELLRRYDKGVFSLAERANCTLMWSHYGDQHRGLCFGYSLPSVVSIEAHKIRYGGSRMVEASLVFAMLDGNSEACRKVDEAVLMRKAADWRYEREWRPRLGRHQHDRHRHDIRHIKRADAQQRAHRRPCSTELHHATQTYVVIWPFVGLYRIGGVCHKAS